MMKFTYAIMILGALLAGCGGEDKGESKGAASANEAASAAAISVKKADPQSAGANKSDAWASYDIEGQKRINFGVGESNATTKAVGAVALVRTPLQSINKNLVREKLGKNFLTKCSACHDDYANGVIGPSLLAKNEQEIFNAIKVYKTGDNQNVLMKDLVKPMKDEEIRELAGEISKFNEQFRR